MISRGGHIVLGSGYWGAYCAGIRVFNSLPPQIREVSHKRHQFKRILKEFLYTRLFYTLDEYFNCKTTNDI
jgi:hypothetical protein